MMSEWQLKKYRMDRSSRANKSQLTPLKRGKGRRVEEQASAPPLTFSMIDQLQGQLVDYEKTLTANAGSIGGGSAMSFGMDTLTSHQDLGGKVSVYVCFQMLVCNTS